MTLKAIFFKTLKGFDHGKKVREELKEIIALCCLLENNSELVVQVSGGRSVSKTAHMCVQSPGVNRGTIIIYRSSLTYHRHSTEDNFCEVTKGPKDKWNILITSMFHGS